MSLRRTPEIVAASFASLALFLGGAAFTKHADADKFRQEAAALEAASGNSETVTRLEARATGMDSQSDADFVKAGLFTLFTAISGGAAFTRKRWPEEIKAPAAEEKKYNPDLVTFLPDPETGEATPVITRASADTYINSIAYINSLDKEDGMGEGTKTKIVGNLYHALSVVAQGRQKTGPRTPPISTELREKVMPYIIVDPDANPRDRFALRADMLPDLATELISERLSLPAVGPDTRTFVSMMSDSLYAENQT